MENSPDHIYFKDLESRFLRCSRTLAEKFGVSPNEVAGKTDFDFWGPEHAQSAFEDEQKIIRSGKPVIGQVEQEQLKDGGLVTWALTNKMPFRNDAGEIIGTFGISKDITELKQAEHARQLMEEQLRQAQKLESIGQLAAGIAHEINTPIQYVGDNTRFLQDSFRDIEKILRCLEDLLRSTKDDIAPPEAIVRLQEMVLKSDLAYVLKQVPEAFSETLEGVDRVAHIVRAMKEFSHPGNKDKSPGGP